MARSWLEGLLGIFSSDALDSDEFETIPSATIPEPCKKLLDHHHHMTVTLEEHLGCPVHLNVLEVYQRDDDYARRLTLSAGRDGPVVLAGVMRFSLQHCDESLRREIIAAATPLGRILVEHNVMRRLQTVAFLRIPLQSTFCKVFDLPTPSRLPVTHAHGRLAMIFCDEQPAVELLEVLAPTCHSGPGDT